MKGCGSMRNEDMISELPDALLLQILSLIPTKDAVATCVLSKRWRFLCKMMPNLKFCYGGTSDIERFSDNVCGCLLSHKAPVLQNFHLEMNFENDSIVDVGVMNLIMGVAFGRHVRELELEVNCADELYRFPTSLFNCGTLETLKLDCDVLVDVPFPVCLKSLRTLSLFDVSYKDDESVVNLLSGCSMLENMDVKMYPHPDVHTFTIDVPSLQSLTLSFENANDNYFTIFVINAPSLKHLKIDGLREYAHSCLIENMPELIEADISILSGVIYENIHGTLTSVKRLCLDIESPLDLTKFPTDRIFNQLVHLELNTVEPEWWSLFLFMLDSSPNLQVLKLVSYGVRDEDCGAYERWSQPKYVAECLLNRLETLVWKKYVGGIEEDDREVARYILRNASRLKTASFSTRDIPPEMKLEWLKELESVVRASNSCKLVFK